MEDDTLPERLFAVCGLSMGTLPEQGVLLELRYLPTPTSPNDQALSIGFMLTSAQARDLSKYLADMAAAAEDRTDHMPQTMQ